VPRTTIDIDAGVLRELKRRQRKEGKTLGQLVSELLAASMRKGDEPARRLRWKAKGMRPRVDLEDKEAVRRALEGR
jgi:hypothetical protein